MNMNSIEKCINTEVGYPTYQKIDDCVLTAISTTFVIPKK
jgi:hypothetical protein